MKNYIKKIGNENLRIDGRGFDDFRDIKIELGVAKKAEGSAMVTIGDTKVIAGVKMALGEPFSDTPDEGALMVDTDRLQIAFSEWEGGPPSNETIEIARTVDRGIRESKMVDFKKLCIRKGELIWKVFIDVYPLNYDGNIIDASSLAAVAAILNARMPKVENDKVLYGQLTDKKLPVDKIPLTTSFVKVGKHLVVDPGLKEEELMDARLSITTSGVDSINALQKSGSGGFTVDEVKELIEKSFKIRKVLEKALGVKK
ncbi:MAG: exosome complex protein Rrp42 [Candidatus Nanoarchaeia archaeon]|jgi:exosome complex component RRP42